MASSFLKTIGVLTVTIVIVGILGYASFTPRAGHPEESRRVTHAAGFSIVRPVDWDYTIILPTPRANQNAIQMGEAKSEVRPSYITVTQVDGQPTEPELVEKGFEKSELRKAPAWRKIVDTKRDRSVFYLFPDSGRWFEIKLQRPKNESFDGVWMEYLESFRSTDPSMTEPGTQAAQ